MIASGGGTGTTGQVLPNATLLMLRRTKLRDPKSCSRA